MKPIALPKLSFDELYSLFMNHPTKTSPFSRVAEPEASKFSSLKMG
jgi:hypothetical protein